jgi:23S rRNA (cytidine1920-2'-O)/16S rRNA (cytidine1409-2'-O)-methyltransferase
MTPKTPRKRLDILLVERGLAETIQKAQGIILAGDVRVDGARADKAGAAIAEDARIQLSGKQQKYASRGGVKLEGALEDFQVSAAGKICLDVGASTGGFTDCLLQHGAMKVYGVDVNVDQMDWKLQQNTRVIRIKRNARELNAAEIPEKVDLVVADVSFISVGKVLRPGAEVAKPGAEFLILIKPQFELRRGEIGEGGIVVDPGLHEKAIEIVRAAAGAAGIECLDVKPSRLTGAEGNQEFFLHARKRAEE